MVTLASLLLAILAWLFAIPVFVFCAEILVASVVPQRNIVSAAKNGLHHRIAVLVPAHNESSGLVDTLNDVKKQLHSGDRLLVVADNCTDDTAAIAKAAGAEVTERHDLGKIG